MINLSDINYVKKLQSDMIAVFTSPAGKDILKFLEKTCGWYSTVFDPTNRDNTLVQDGRRQVVATIKTLMELKPEEIVALDKQRR